MSRFDLGDAVALLGLGAALAGLWMLVTLPTFLLMVGLAMLAWATLSRS